MSDSVADGSVDFRSVEGGKELPRGRGRSWVHRETEERGPRIQTQGDRRPYRRKTLSSKLERKSSRPETTL